jgi:hypothetical protein
MLKRRGITMARTARYGVLVGLAGGIAEIIWIAVYGSLTAVDATEVARAVSATGAWLLPGIPLVFTPVVHGIVIHMVAAVALGIALSVAWRTLTARTSLRINPYTFMIGALTIVWTFNFLVLLPLIAPAITGVQHAFFELLPYPVSFASKILFGLAGAAMLRNDAALTVQVQSRPECA